LETLEPGKKAIATVRFLTHQPVEQYLQIGKVWWIHEGKNKIGEAKIVSVKLIDTESEK